MYGATPIEVQVAHVGDTDVVSPAGEIDIATAPDVRRALLATVGGRRLVLDLRGVEFMDTSGLKLLVDEHRRARERGGRFAIVEGPPRVQRLLDVAGLTGRLQVVGAIDDLAAGDAHSAA
jgi:anti-sigma B factor antagonist